MVTATTKDMLKDRQFMDDMEYLGSRIDQIRASHPDCYVAASHGEIVAADPDLTRVIALLKERGIPTHITPVVFVSKEPRHFVL